MKIKTFYLIFSFISIFVGANATNTQFNPDYTLWYDSPATIWEETLPLGNGRMGIMPDGGIEHENIVLNEISMWSGSEYDYSNSEASKYLPEIRAFLIEGKNDLAQKMMYEHFVPKKPEKGGTYGCYQILGNLKINYYFSPQEDSEIKDETLEKSKSQEKSLSSNTYSDYTRGLDLETGVAWTQFTTNGATFRREYSTPRNGDGILIKLTASEPGKINFSYTLSRAEKSEIISSQEDKRLLMKGELDSGQENFPGIKFCVGSGAKIKGARASLSLVNDSIISVKEADEAWIAVSGTTSYSYGENYLGKEEALLNNLLKNPDEIFDKGKNTHKELMDRASLTLLTNKNSFLPTDQRILEFQTDDSDTSLAALYFNYGRYLLISSTRPDLLPPNLQGLWANTLSTPWNGDYHTNINIQMNHWGAEAGNLSEFHIPLATLVKRLVKSGERTAKAFYGEEAEGWVLHMMTNIWNYTEPGENPSWGATNTGGAWLCNHLWDHYDFTGDKEFLKEYYDVMKGAALFFLSTMITLPEEGWLVTAPSSSPENSFYLYPENDTAVSVCLGPAMDTQIIGELWGYVIKASEILGINDEDIPRIKEALGKLPPMKIDSQGRLMEWLEEYKETDVNHRHVSHLYGLYPGNSINSTTPELMEAAKKTLEIRGDEGTGWSRAWKINFHSRLYEGDKAWKIFKGLLQPAITDITSRRRAGTFPNLFCSHPPFQIDGNFGGAAGIGEMLIQSHEGFINILPALPEKLIQGKLEGFKTRGGNTINLEWKNNLPIKAEILGGFHENISIKMPEGISKVEVSHEGKNEILSVTQNFINLNIPENKKFELIFLP